MTASTRFQLAAVAALLAAAPIAASAEQTAYAENPVAITSVQNEQNFFSLPYAAQRIYTNGLAVAFTNTTNVAANDVEFAITRAGKTSIVAEHGTYAPGARIARQLAFDTDITPSAEATVSIAKVNFADGSTWTPASGRVAQR